LYLPLSTSLCIQVNGHFAFERDMTYDSWLDSSTAHRLRGCLGAHCIGADADAGFRAVERAYLLLPE